MNPYDFNPYSPFSSDVIYSKGPYSCDYAYEPEKIVAAQMDHHVSSLPDQLYHHTYRQPVEYRNRQYFASPIPISENDEDFFEWFIKSNDFYVILLFVLIVLVINFIVVASRSPLLALGIITPRDPAHPESDIADVKEKLETI